MFRVRDSEMLRRVRESGIENLIDKPKKPLIILRSLLPLFRFEGLSFCRLSYGS
jgi:hypothetical protein